MNPIKRSGVPGTPVTSNPGPSVRAARPGVAAREPQEAGEARPQGDRDVLEGAAAPAAFGQRGARFPAPVLTPAVNPGAVPELSARLAMLCSKLEPEPITVGPPVVGAMLATVALAEHVGAAVLCVLLALAEAEHRRESEDVYPPTPAQRQSLARAGLQLRPIAPDGNCFYNALIATGAYEGNAWSLRAELAKAALDSEELLHFGLDREEIAMIALQILSDHSFAHVGGDVAPQLAPNALGCQLVVHNEDGSTHKLGEDSERQFHLVRVTQPLEHYHAALPPEVRTSLDELCNVFSASSVAR